MLIIIIDIKNFYNKSVGEHVIIINGLLYGGLIMKAKIIGSVAIALIMLINIIRMSLNFLGIELTICLIIILVPLYYYWFKSEKKVKKDVEVFNKNKITMTSRDFVFLPILLAVTFFFIGLRLLDTEVKILGILLIIYCIALLGITLRYWKVDKRKIKENVVVVNVDKRDLYAKHLYFGLIALVISVSIIYSQLNFLSPRLKLLFSLLLALTFCYWILKKRESKKAQHFDNKRTQNVENKCDQRFDNKYDEEQRNKYKIKRLD